MKILFLTLSLISLSTWAQDPSEYLKLFDAKVYSLKTKGVKDFALDISSSRLTKQINDAGSFGMVKELVFKVYWTASPERLVIDVHGLPAGFREVKEELKMSILPYVEDLLPLPLEKKFTGYKITQGPSAKEFLAKDSTGVAGIPSFLIKFDSQDKLTEVMGQKPVGSFIVSPVYQKESFSDGKWVLKKSVTTSAENGQTLIVTKVLNYGTSSGISVLTSINVSSDQKFDRPDVKSIALSESLDLSNYKIDQGVAFKYFLNESKVP